MPTYTLALIRSTLKEQVSKSTLVAVAKTIGVNALGLKKVIAGKATPNVRTADKYAKHLGITTAELNQVLALATKAKPAKQAKGVKNTKAAKKAKVTKTEKAEVKAEKAEKPATGKRRGRPPGSGNKKKPASEKAPAEKPVTGKRRGRPPGSAKAKTPAPAALKKSDSIVSTFLELMDALTTPDAISSDELALAVHSANEGQRKLIQALVNAF